MFALVFVLLAAPPEPPPGRRGWPRTWPRRCTSRPTGSRSMSSAAATPPRAVGDFYGDGKPALLVGQFSGGKLRIYRNLGTAKVPKFGGFEWFKASEALGTIEPG